MKRTLSELTHEEKERITALGNMIMPQQIFPIIEAIAKIKMAKEQEANETDIIRTYP